MAPQRPAGRVGAPDHLRTPLPLEGGQVDLVEDQIDDAVEDFVLSGDVVVQRHRLGAEVSSERADRERCESADVRDGHGTAEDAVTAQ